MSEPMGDQSAGSTRSFPFPSYPWAVQVALALFLGPIPALYPRPWWTVIFQGRTSSKDLKEVGRLFAEKAILQAPGLCPSSSILRFSFPLQLQGGYRIPKIIYFFKFIPRPTPTKVSLGQERETRPIGRSRRFDMNYYSSQSPFACTFIHSCVYLFLFEFQGSFFCPSRGSSVTDMQIHKQNLKSC